MQLRRGFALGFVFLGLGAVAGEAQFQQVDEVVVRPGGEARYETLLGRIRDAATTTGSDHHWMVFEVVTGRPAPTYRIVTSFERFQERDGWTGARALLSRAFGDETAEREWSEGHSVVESIDSQVWQSLPDSDSNLRDELASFYEVYVREVRPGTEREIRRLHREFKKAYDAAPSRPSVARSALWFGRNQSLVFRRASGFDSWSTLDDAEARGILGKHFGADKAQEMVDTVRAAAIWTDHFVVALRRDLSHLPPR